MMTQCDRIFYVTWSLLPDQLLSTAYLKIKRTGWLMTGNCTVNGVVVVSSKLYFMLAIFM